MYSVAPSSTNCCTLWHSTRMGLGCQYHGQNNWWCCGVMTNWLWLPCTGLHMQWNSYGSPIISHSSWCETIKSDSTGFLMVAMHSYWQYLFEQDSLKVYECRWIHGWLSMGLYQSLFFWRLEWWWLFLNEISSGKEVKMKDIDRTWIACLKRFAEHLAESVCFHHEIEGV